MNKQKVNFYEHLLEVLSENRWWRSWDRKPGWTIWRAIELNSEYLVAFVQSLLQLQLLLHNAIKWSAHILAELFQEKNLQEFQFSDGLATCAGLQTQPLPWDSWGWATETFGDLKAGWAAIGKRTDGSTRLQSRLPADTLLCEVGRWRPMNDHLTPRSDEEVQSAAFNSKVAGEQPLWRIMSKQYLASDRDEASRPSSQSIRQSKRSCFFFPAEWEMLNKALGLADRLKLVILLFFPLEQR